MMLTCKHLWGRCPSCERCGIDLDDFHDVVRQEVRELERENAKLRRVCERQAAKLAQRPKR